TEPPTERSTAPAVAAMLVSGLLGMLAGDARAFTSSDITFPLTPALSLGERVNRLPFLGNADIVSHSSAWIFERTKDGDRAGTVEIAGKRPYEFPLPEGEGQGEGEEDVQLSAGAAFVAMPLAQWSGSHFRWLHWVEQANTAMFLHGFFLLTPALSLRERENPSQFLGIADIISRSYA